MIVSYRCGQLYLFPREEKWRQLPAGAALQGEAIFLCSGLDSGVSGILPLCPRSTTMFDWIELHPRAPSRALFCGGLLARKSILLEYMSMNSHHRYTLIDVAAISVLLEESKGGELLLPWCAHVTIY